MIRNLVLFYDEAVLRALPALRLDIWIKNVLADFYRLLIRTPDNRLEWLLQILIGLPVVTVTAVLAFILIIFGASIAAIVGLRNRVEYSLWQQLLAFAIPIAVIFCIPFIAPQIYLSKVSTIMTFTIALLGVDVLFGRCGIVSFGHAGFLALGAYFTAWFYGGMFGFTLPFSVAVFCAGLAAALVSIVIGLPAIRVKDHHLAIVTMAFVITIPTALKSKYLSHYSGLRTGGLQIKQPDVPQFLGAMPASTINYLIVAFFFLLLIYFSYNLLRHSQVGRAFQAIKCDVEVASMLGVPVFRYKLFAFALSAFYTAIAGGLLLLQSRFIAPESYELRDSMHYSVANMLGGVGSILGAFLGGCWLTLEGEAGQRLSHVIPRSDRLMSAISGVLLIFTVYAAPTGLAGKISSIVSDRFFGKVKRGKYRISPPEDYDPLLEKKFPVDSIHLGERK